MIGDLSGAASFSGAHLVSAILAKHFPGQCQLAGLRKRMPKLWPLTPMVDKPPIESLEAIVLVLLAVIRAASRRRDLGV